MRPDIPPDACWTSFIGAPTHNLGDLPEKCFTCAAKRRESSLAPDGSASRARAILDYEACRLKAAERDSAPKVGQD